MEALVFSLSQKLTSANEILLHYCTLFCAARIKKLLQELTTLPSLNSLDCDIAARILLQIREYHSAEHSGAQLHNDSNSVHHSS